MRNTFRKVLPLLLAAMLLTAPASVHAESVEETAEIEETVLQEQELIPVVVDFRCDPEETVVKLYAKEDLDTVLECQKDGTYLLLPGEYFYDASCPGYAPVTMCALTVENGADAFTVTVELEEAEPVALTAEEANAALMEDKAIYADGALIWSFCDTNGVLEISGDGEVSEIPEGIDKARVRTIVFRENEGEGSGITKIGLPFYDFSNLGSISIPGSVVHINRSGLVAGEKNRFNWYLREIRVSADNEVYMDVNGVLFKQEDGIPVELMRYPTVSNVTDYTIPATVTAIDSYAFIGATRIVSVRIPADSALQNIGNGAFAYCSKLKSFTFPDNMEKVPDYFFNNCKELRSVTIPETVTSIGASAFCGCSNLSDVRIPENVTEIGSGAFQQCGSLKSIDIPGGVTVIGPRAFQECKGLTEIVLPEGIEYIDESTFKSCTGLKSITVPASVSNIQYEAFDGCEALQDVYFGSSRDTWNEVEEMGVSFGNDCLLQAELVEGFTAEYDAAGVDREENGKDAVCACGTVHTAQNPNADVITSKDLPYALTAPEKLGHTFLGWFDDSGKEIAEITAENAENIHLTAKWQRDRYAIRCELNGGECTSEGKDSYDAAELPIHSEALAEPVKENYVFAGWFTDAKCTNALEDASYEKMGDMTLFAKWELPKYALILDANGGEEMESREFDASMRIALPRPQREGYTFIGWTDSTGTGFTSVSKNTMPAFDSGKDSASVTLTARWKPVEYRISYNLNGGKADGETRKTYTTEQEVELTAAQRPGYAFGGWYRDSKYTDSVEKIPSGTTGNISLYAKWDVVPYTVSYATGIDCDGDGKEDVSVEDAQYDVTKTVRLPSLKWEDHLFQGWYDTESDAKVTYIPANSGKDFALEARWEKKTNPVRYMLGGGENNAENPVKAAKDEVFELKEPIRSGCRFLGWYSDAAGKNPVERIENIEKPVTVYAKWEVLPYEVTFDTDGGKEIAPVSYNVNKAVYLPRPVKEGVQFAGWFADEAHTQPVTNLPRGTVGDRTLYAKWTKGAYAVRYMLNGGAAKDNPNPAKNDYETTLELQEPVRKGYVFCGWFADAAMQEQVTCVEAGRLTAVTLYAKWEPAQYKVSYELDGGENPDANPETVTCQKGVALKQPVKEGFTFGGWYKDAELTSRITSVGGWGCDGDVTVYAKWIPAK